MEISIATPAMLFPAISLLLLAFTQRFLTLATLTRSFANDYEKENVLLQIQNFRKRIALIRSMQQAGVLSFFFCVLSMLLIYFKLQQWGSWVFGISLVLLMYSLILSIKEIHISMQALDVHLEQVLKDAKQKR
ncbi:MAG: DUF2721 domain-containing protein [Glaciecola sp.]|jgi:uncharacterized membrane protein YagU involved in acid resistance